MSSCLGLYIQDNIIKYAKVTKERESLKIDAFGVKFYDDLHEAVEQIVSETQSHKLPLSINLSKESYDYFYLFSLLSKNDIKKSVDIEFESLCNNKGYNKNTLESRYSLVPFFDDNQKIKVINISDKKTEINSRLESLEGKNVSNITPLPLTITNILESKENENAVIVNMEEDTTITTIIDQKIYNVDKLDVGINDTLKTISDKENSFSKAYEICKNTTIYTMDVNDSENDEDRYLKDIMPTLYKVVEETKKIIDGSTQRIQKIYITGTGVVINNIDLYFQEYFSDCKCEILRPYFLSENLKTNIKDYIEVNSAVALAMQGLGYGIRNINFKDSQNSKKKLNIELDKKKTRESKGKLNDILNREIKFDFKVKNGTFDNLERWLIRTASGILAFIIIYSCFSLVLTNVTNGKTAEVDETQKSTNSQIALVEKDTTAIENKTSKYKELLDGIKDYKNENSENRKVKNSIPNFLTSLMYALPKGVSIKSVTNTTGYTIRIVAQAKLYSQLAYLIASIKTTDLLSNVTSSSGVKNGDAVTVVIEGSLFPE